MRIYEVRISHDALQDMASLQRFLDEMLSEEIALRLCGSLQEDQFQDILTDSSRSQAYGLP